MSIADNAVDRKNRLDVHPVADLFPMLATDELDELAADIKERGLLQPIVLDVDGRVLDGRNRLAACERAGVEPTFTCYEGEDPDGYALAVNIARRHLMPKQRYILIEKARQLAGSSKCYSSKSEQVSLSLASIVWEYAPDLAEEIVAGGGPSLRDAADMARERKRKTQEIEASKARLRADAPDLHDLVAEERMSVDDAVAALNAREEKARTEAEQNERLKAAAKQESLNRWSQAVDGLTNALSFAKTYSPPDEMPPGYLSADDLIGRITELLDIAEGWANGG